MKILTTPLVYRWQKEARTQTTETLGVFVKSVLTDCAHSNEDGLSVQAAVACALAGLYAFENGGAALTYDDAVSVVGEIERHWAGGG